MVRKVCIYHPTMGEIITREITQRYPAVEVRVVRAESGFDSACLQETEILIANTLPAGLLRRFPRLQWLHLTGTGVEHVRQAAPSPDLYVTNSRNVPARAVAEFVWMGLLAMAKDAVRLVQQQERHHWQLPTARLVAGSRMVLVGLGQIGSAIAQRAAAFEVKITAITASAQPSPSVEQVLPPQKLAEAAAQADHLVLAVPTTPATYQLVNEAVMRALPRTATLINVSRSSVLDTEALVRALREGRLRGALLDVHDEEPLPITSPLWEVENLWITPHGAYRFPEEEREVAHLFVHNLACWLCGKELRNRVDLTACSA